MRPGAGQGCRRRRHPCRRLRGLRHHALWARLRRMRSGCAAACALPCRPHRSFGLPPREIRLESGHRGVAALAAGLNTGSLMLGAANVADVLQAASYLQVRSVGSQVPGAAAGGGACSHCRACQRLLEAGCLQLHPSGFIPSCIGGGSPGRLLSLAAGARNERPPQPGPAGGARPGAGQPGGAD